MHNTHNTTQQTEIQILLQQKLREMRELTELSTLTTELARAIDRKDDVSIKMVLAMRQEPLLRLEEIRQLIERWLGSLPQDKAIHMAELLNGGEAESPEEEPLQQQIVANYRMMSQIQELDKRISLRSAGRHSFYFTY